MTTPIGIQRIEKRLDRFQGAIDMIDWASRPVEQVRVAFLSRAVAAYCVKILAQTDDDTAGKSVTDSFHDRGIDAIYFDARSSRLIVVQSKWSDVIAWKEAGEFTDGVRRLIGSNFDSFKNNEKIYKRKKELAVILETPGIRILLVTAHKGVRAGDPGSLRRVDEFVAQIDDGLGLAESVHWHLPLLLEAMQTESAPKSIEANITISNWGEIKEPYHAVYGRVQAKAIADLWKSHPHLAHVNLREYSVQRTDVNAAIAKTVLEEPSHFWYFNNGLTIICDAIVPAVGGRLEPSLTVFRFENIRLVNGAQTTGVISNNIHALSEEDGNVLWIQLRAIAVGNCPDGFATEITKFTNLQNAVSQQDFVALDPIQARLSVDFAVEGRRYAFKWGTEPDPAGKQGCTLKEATVALACAELDPWFAVQAKREIGVLWNTGSDKYSTLFHENLTAQRVWNAVAIMRNVEFVLALSDRIPRTRLVAVHLNLVIVHLVFRSDKILGWHEKTDLEGIGASARELAQQMVDRLCKYVSAVHEGEYLASLSKHQEKCQSMIKHIQSALATPPAGQAIQLNLFADRASSENAP